MWFGIFGDLISNPRFNRRCDSQCVVFHCAIAKAKYGETNLFEGGLFFAILLSAESMTFAVDLDHEPQFG